MYDEKDESSLDSTTFQHLGQKWFTLVKRHFIKFVGKTHQTSIIYKILQRREKNCY